MSLLIAMAVSGSQAPACRCLEAAPLGADEATRVEPHEIGDLIAPLPPGEDTTRRRHLHWEEGLESADALISDFGLQNWEK